MLITIDQLLSYTPWIVNGKKYWRQGSRVYSARINIFGLVELTDVTAQLNPASTT